MGDFAAAIFDLDGTLLDSMRVWERIDFDFLTKRGISIPGDYAATVASLSFRQTARYTIDRFSLGETEDEIMREWQDMARREYAENVRLKARAAEYLALLKRSGVKLATATSLHPELAESALRGNGVLDLFDALCSTDEAGRGKEFPDVFTLAARRLGVSPGACVVFEDILPAVRSAKAAGMRVFCVEDDASLRDREELKKTADGYIRDFRDAPLP